MRKHFLLIVYVTLALFTQKSSGARSYTVAEKSGASCLFLKSDKSSDECSAYREAHYFITDADLEDDGEVKAKSISSGDFLYQFTYLQHLNKIKRAEYPAPYHPAPSGDLFKLNQVFRL